MTMYDIYILGRSTDRNTANKFGEAVNGVHHVKVQCCGELRAP